MYEFPITPNHYIMHHKLDRYAFAHPFYVGLIAGLLIGSAITAFLIAHIMHL